MKVSSKPEQQTGIEKLKQQKKECKMYQNSNQIVHITKG